MSESTVCTMPDGTAILHVDDDPTFADLTTTFLERENDRFTVETATGAEEGLERIAGESPDCIVSDYNMPGMDGLEFLEAVRETHPDLPFILFTGKGSEEVASDAIAAGVTDYIQKGSGSDRYALLANRIENAVESRREAKRADRREQLMRLTEFAGDTGGFELETDTGAVVLTDGARRILDLPEQANPNFEKNLQHYHPDDRENIRQTIQRALETGEQTHGTWRYQHPDGEQKLLGVTYTPVTANGETTRVRGAINDITEQKEREAQLRETTGQLQDVIDTVEAAMWIRNTDNEYVYMNQHHRDLFDIADDTDITGKSPGDLHPAEVAEQFQRNDKRVYETKEQVEIEETVETDDGRREFLTRIVPLFDDGSVYATCGIATDITEQKSRERRLEQFTSIVSHDLRNPLNVAEGRLELARETCESDHLTQVADALDRSQALIDDLLKLAQGGETVGEPERVELADVAERGWRSVETGPATLELDTTQTLRADRSRLQELVENLYRNAVEHGSDDVTVSVGAMDDGFYVADTGTGIPGSEREEVFEPGYSTSEDGTGFGLQIVEQIAEAHGWEVGVRESEQCGARFEFTGVEIVD